MRGVASRSPFRFAACRARRLALADRRIEAMHRADTPLTRCMTPGRIKLTRHMYVCTRATEQDDTLPRNLGTRQKRMDEEKYTTMIRSRPEGNSFRYEIVEQASLTSELLIFLISATSR